MTTSAYPGALDNFDEDHADEPTRRIGPDVDVLLAAMNRVQAELGANPSGGSATVAAAIASLGGADTAGSVALASAVATLTSAINAKQDLSTAATDAEVTAVQASLTAAVAGVQSAVDALAAAGATDAEVAAAVAALAATVATDAELAAEAATRAAADARTDNPHAVTKAQIGLGSVDNTSDAAKPVSTAQQAALDLDRARLAVLEGVRRAYIVAPPGWNTVIKAVRAVGPGHIAIRGDSIGAGQGASDWVPKGFFGKLRDAVIASGVLLAGEYFPMDYSASVNGSVGASTPWSVTKPDGTFKNIYEAGFGRVYNIQPSGGAIDQITFTSPAGCTGLDFIYGDFQGGTMKATLDGVLTTINCTGTSTESVTVIKRQQWTGLTAGVHVLQIGTGQFSNTIQILGVLWRTANTTGMFFSRHAHPGIAACNLVTPAGTNTGSGGVKSYPSDKVGILGAQTAGINFTGPPTQADLWINELGVNDAISHYDIDAMRQAWFKIVRAQRAGKANCSIVFVIPAYPGLYTDVTISGSNAEMWPRYKVAIYEVAAAFNAAVLDLDAKWGATPFAQGFMLNNNVHPTDAGHADIALDLASMIAA